MPPFRSRHRPRSSGVEGRRRGALPRRRVGSAFLVPPGEVSHWWRGGTSPNRTWGFDRSKGMDRRRTKGVLGGSTQETELSTARRGDGSDGGWKEGTCSKKATCRSEGVGPCREGVEDRSKFIDKRDGIDPHHRSVQGCHPTSPSMCNQLNGPRPARARRRTWPSFPDLGGRCKLAGCA